MHITRGACKIDTYHQPCAIRGATRTSTLARCGCCSGHAYVILIRGTFFIVAHATRLCRRESHALYAQVEQRTQYSMGSRSQRTTRAPHRAEDVAAKGIPVSTGREDTSSGAACCAQVLLVSPSEQHMVLSCADARSWAPPCTHLVTLLCRLFTTYSRSRISQLPTSIKYSPPISEVAPFQAHPPAHCPFGSPRVADRTAATPRLFLAA